MQIPIPEPTPPPTADVYMILRGPLKGYIVRRVRRINPVIWVCEVQQVNRANLTNIPIGAEVLVHTNDFYELPPPFPFTTVPTPDIHNLRIGSWNIRCTGEFQCKKVFLHELLVRFERLAAFIHKSKCDIVALQEFPYNFSHAEESMYIEARHLLPEFINKLNAVQDEEWDFGYSEDFPQECWESHRNVKHANGFPIDKYSSRNGKHIQAFVFKKRCIKMHSVEQILDMKYQENRFKHAPVLGRFSFMDSFHFSLVNVHLRPFVAKSDARYEIEDLGKCINQLRKYNPDSTIILGDFNMSASHCAPESSTIPRNQLTEFLPHVDGVWESFETEGYRHVVQNRFTNVAENRQFDNIWLPKELYPKAIINKTQVIPQVKASYEQSENVLRLQDIFAGVHGNNQVITDITDHHLVYVDLEIDVSEKTALIKKVIEIDNSSGDLNPREYDGFIVQTPAPLTVRESKIDQLLMIIKEKQEELSRLSADDPNYNSLQFGIDTLMQDLHDIEVEVEFLDAEVRTQTTASAVPTSEFITNALRNYENFHGLPTYTATVQMLETSSAGLEGWGNYNPNIISGVSSSDASQASGGGAKK